VLLLGSLELAVDHAARAFSDEDLERLRSFPEINREELIRFFTLTAADVEFIDPQRGRGPSERLGER
jgi:hypothetical protein